jgi:hypothetical protein
VSGKQWWWCFQRRWWCAGGFGSGPNTGMQKNQFCTLPIFHIYVAMSFSSFKI